MSFSSKVKEELARHMGSARHCKIAETTAIINLCGKVGRNSEGMLTGLKIQTENPAVARKCFTLFKKTFNIKIDISIRKSQQLGKHRVYQIVLADREDTLKVLRACRLLEGETMERRISPMVIQTTCCKRAYIRGAFLATGSMSDPEKTYHLEFVNQEAAHAQELSDLVNSFEMDSKIVLRKKYHVVYLKEGRQIVDLLNIMEAHVALMDLENLRILKDMRNNVNRIVNCETANLNKTVSAAVKQVNDIEYIEAKQGLHTLTESLEIMARLRLDNPSASLKEMGEMLSPPVGKSGVNHRLRKISQIADNLRNKSL